MAILLGCGGCEIVTLATVSTMLDIAGTVATTGPEVFSMGKLSTALMADDGEIQKAVRRAGADLHLHLVRDRQEKSYRNIWDFQFQDDRKSKIEVTVEKRAGMLCWLRVNVGIFGSEPTARLIMHRIESHLPPTAAAPGTK